MFLLQLIDEHLWNVNLDNAIKASNDLKFIFLSLSLSIRLLFLFLLSARHSWVNQNGHNWCKKIFYLDNRSGQNDASKDRRIAAFCLSWRCSGDCRNCCQTSSFRARQWSRLWPNRPTPGWGLKRWEASGWSWSRQTRRCCPGGLYWKTNLLNLDILHSVS